MSAESPDDPLRDEDRPEPIQGQVRHHGVSARVTADVGEGVFSNGVMILVGAYEIVLDFALRMGEQQRIAARVICPILSESSWFMLSATTSAISNADLEPCRRSLASYLPNDRFPQKPRLRSLRHRLRQKRRWEEE